MNESQAKSGGPGLGKLLAGMGVFVLIGFPMVFFIWRFVNDVLSGRFVPLEAAIALVFLLIFVWFLKFLARRVRRWDAELST